MRGRRHLSCLSSGPGNEAGACAGSLNPGRDVRSIRTARPAVHITALTWQASSNTPDALLDECRELTGSRPRYAVLSTTVAPGALVCTDLMPFSAARCLGACDFYVE
jgi:hypothetical protein